MILSILLDTLTEAGAEKSPLQAAQKDPDARRAKIDERRRTLSTLERRDGAQRSRWTFFNSLLQDDTHRAVVPQRFQVENGFPVMDLQLSVYPRHSVLVATDIGARFAHAEAIDEKR
jgi:hypothetical protein